MRHFLFLTICNLLNKMPLNYIFVPTNKVTNDVMTRRCHPLSPRSKNLHFQCYFIIRSRSDFHICNTLCNSIQISPSDVENSVADSSLLMTLSSQLVAPFYQVALKFCIKFLSEYRSKTESVNESWTFLDRISYFNFLFQWQNTEGNGAGLSQ